MERADPRGLLAELSKLEGKRHQSPAAKRRRHPRYVVRGDAQLAEMDRPSSNEPPQTVMLRDMGRGGIGFISERPVDVGATKRLRVIQRGYGIGDLSVIVRHCGKVKDQVYLVGTQICIDNGLMYLLGVDPGELRDADAPDGEPEAGDFLPPAEVA